MKRHNFNSGPSILPDEVLRRASEAVIDFNGLGLSILEIGHRTPWFTEVIEEGRSLVKELMGLDDTYSVLFLQGGATTQFMQVPLNLLPVGGHAAYIKNGIWGSKAIKEASVFGQADVIGDTSDRNHSYIQKTFSVPDGSSYLHYTSNNTVEGTQWHTLPEAGQTPLIADMSSDIFSRPVAFDKHALIYAGAQKNAGAAGTTIVAIKKDMLGKTGRNISPILDYEGHIKAESMLNTPPVFAVYVSMLTMRWIKEQGGLAEMEKRAKQRADLFYSALDNLEVFTPIVDKQDRSLMNATFTTSNKDLEAPFLELCKENAMVGVKGHRSVGGLRVSMYNAMPLSSVQALVDLMEKFNQANK
ncbi:phosphoserine aminotransferase apoenzyme [Arachidicoccus rhizosphaerae]|jgi:phosphoserine aminotransferase|uniref:Phosphoserine aminotransferase n=1 Tax=Arachidicoccus rhizosphaerae TaxID=551991 RepID=A0A1H3ZLH4_9BACT|nr:3-phosphoserine/phosphohydroxythreonine transaminase [Arachidicoccus rhizosphaerae]SEA24629.1 phosphoserine aminotransferase apoenzyme [Arachidicoccus rhizosphaerae]